MMGKSSWFGTITSSVVKKIKNKDVVEGTGRNALRTKAGTKRGALPGGNQNKHLE